MRNRSVITWSITACICLLLSSAVRAEERADASAVEGVSCSGFEDAVMRSADGEAYIPAPRPLPDDVEIVQEVAYADGGDGGTVSDSAASFLVYNNNLSKQVTGPAGSASTARVSDDVAITVRATCLLDKYAVRVTGDRENTGSAPLFTVTTTIYRTCPGAGLATAIPGTTCTFNESGLGVKELTCVATTDVKLPENFYVSISFSRDNCGIIVGAPPVLGFSADRFDFPGFPCRAFLGGYPTYRHASFWLQIYTRDEDCPRTFTGYMNSNHAGNAYTPGAGLFYAEDVRLGVPECNMIAYEVSVKGNGIFKFDLKTFLVNGAPEFGGRIPGTEGAILSVSPAPQVARVVVDPPISMPPNFYVSFETSSSLGGPIFTNQPASLGSTEDFFYVYENGVWVARPYSQQTFAAFNISIICEGEPRVGACCDMVQLDTTGESVCRHLPEMNCGFQDLWVEYATCDDFCKGGPNDGQPCTRQADCPGYSCVGGVNDGKECDPAISTDCPGGFCRRAKCPGPFPFPCGQSACCTHDDFCYNYTRNECNARPPVDKPRLYLRGRYCGSGGFACPWGACLGRDGECTLPHPWPGCENPFCCTAVCQVDSFCCLVEWDETCASNTFRYCETKPSNDDCWDPDELKGARLVELPSSTESDNLNATEDSNDPGFCCHTDSPGARGYGTVWYRFIATEPTAAVKTCFSNSPADDSLISVYAPADPDRGICDNGAPCSIVGDDCPDGSDCVLDEQYACEHLNLIGCSDDVNDCCSSDKCSSLCLTNLVVGQNYYVLVGSKPDIEPGQYEQLAFRLDVTAPCIQVNPPMPNDFCQGALPVAEECVGGSEDGLPCDPSIEGDCPGGQCRVVEPFDMSGGPTNAPASFHCPGESCVDPIMQNDLWYTWTAPCSGAAEFTTCEVGVDPEDQVPTSMVVYNACQCPVQPGTVVGCSIGELGDCGLAAGVTFVATEGQCYMIRVGGHQGATPAAELKATIECVAGCPAGPVTFVDPEDGAVDARQPFPPADAAQRQGIDAVTVQGPAGIDDPACWTLCETAVDGTANAISGIVDNGDGSFTISLDRTISIGAVTTLTYTESSGTPYIGVFTSHPANVDADVSSSPADILRIIDCLNWLGGNTPPPWPADCPWGVYSCDVDQSGGCAPADILRVIDLLNGADQFDPWLGEALPDCGVCCP